MFKKRDTKPGDDITIRPLTDADLAAFKTIRLEALRDNPLAFGASYEEESHFADSYFAGLLKESLWFGVWHKGQLAGMTAFRIGATTKLCHRAELWSMYLRPDLRGSRVADRLMLYLHDIAQQQNVEQIELHVMEPNIHAHAFYKKHGFSEIGHTQHAIKLADGSYRDDFTLIRFLAI